MPWTTYILERHLFLEESSIAFSGTVIRDKADPDGHTGVATGALIWDVVRAAGETQFDINVNPA